jgi:DNA (cytosine-5)-methyltransferase 1
MQPPKVIDLFCGAGGFSLGAHQAGFDVIASVDIDEKLTSSYKSNFPNAKLLLADISALQIDSLLKAADVTAIQVDGIIGGPPCQGFSTIGKRDSGDPRNALLRHFFRIVTEMRPKFFLMENVPGLIAGDAKTTFDTAVSGLEGYELVGPLCLDAHDLGAPTRRKRIVVLGYDPCRVERITEKDICSLSTAVKATVRDAIADLPEPSTGTAGAYRKIKALSKYAMRARTTPKQGLGSTASRKRAVGGKVNGVQPTRHSATVIERFSGVAQGKTDAVSRCARLKWDAAAPTLRAGTGPDKGSFQSVRPIHPARPRVITIREAARLQGFPDWFDFHETKWHSFRMIGNSVSPIMAEVLLTFIAKKIKRSNTGCDESVGSIGEMKSNF